MKKPTLSVDVVIEYPDGEIILAKRKTEPFKGEWGLPGGHVEYGETVEHAAQREVMEETGLQIELLNSNCKVSENHFANLKASTGKIFLISPVAKCKAHPYLLKY